MKIRRVGQYCVMTKVDKPFNIIRQSIKPIAARNAKMNGYNIVFFKRFKLSAFTNGTKFIGSYFVLTLPDIKCV